MVRRVNVLVNKRKVQCTKTDEVYSEFINNKPDVIWKSTKSDVRQVGSDHSVHLDTPSSGILLEVSHASQQHVQEDLETLIRCNSSSLLINRLYTFRPQIGHANKSEQKSLRIFGVSDVLWSPSLLCHWFREGKKSFWSESRPSGAHVRMPGGG